MATQPGLPGFRLRRGPLGPDRAAVRRVALVLVAAALLAPQADGCPLRGRRCIARRPACAPRRLARDGEPGADPGGRRRAGDQAAAARPSGRDLRRAARHPPRGVRPERRARVEAVAPRVQPDVRLLGDADAPACGPRRRDRLRHRRRPSRLRGQDRRREVVRRRLRPRRRGGPRHVRSRSDRSGRQQHGRDRRRRLLGRAPRREGRRRQRPDRRRGRGQGDPLGGRARCARDQHEPRRLPRSARSRPGCVLAARGAGGRLGARQGRRHRRRGREQHRHAAAAVAVRELPGGAPARARRQRARAGRLRPRLLAPGQDLQRHRCARRRHPLDLPARPHGRDEGVPGAGLLELRARRLPQGPGHVVRGAAGERRRRRAAGGQAEPAARAGDGAADADGARRQRRHGLPRVRDPAGPADGLGAPRRERRAEAAPDRGASRARTGSSRTTMPPRTPQPSGAGRTGSRRRSTSGTTRTTSTRSSSSGASRSSSASAGLPARTRT